MVEGVAPELLERNAGITADASLKRIEKSMEGGGIVGDVAPEFVAITFPAIGYQHIAERVPIRHIVPKRAIPQLHPGIVLSTRPKRAVAVEEKGQPPPALVADKRLLINRIPFPEPVGNGQAVGEGLAALAEKIIEGARKAYPEIVVLLYMPVFVDRQHLFPRQAAEIEAILFGGELELAAERGQPNVAVGDRRLVLQHDIDLPLGLTDSRQRGPAQPVDDRRHFLCGGIEPRRINNAGRVSVELSPFQGRRIAAKDLRAGVGGKEEQSEADERQAKNVHVVGISIFRCPKLHYFRNISMKLNLRSLAL